MNSFKSKTDPGGLQSLHQLTQSGCSSSLRFLPLLGAVALTGFLVSCGSKTETLAPPPAPQTNAAPSAAAVSPELAKLVGKWQRPDGGYVVDIRSVDPSGKLDVGYFNPNPINVSRAAAWRDKGATKVVIELRDVNYPGSTYNLELNPETDQLFGQYFQAAMGETFEVVFSRLK
jgi:uncharacterized protein (DUF2147 family)